jgi:hypothetical protein
MKCLMTMATKSVVLLFLFAIYLLVSPRPPSPFLLLIDELIRTRNPIRNPIFTEMMHQISKYHNTEYIQYIVRKRHPFEKKEEPGPGIELKRTLWTFGSKLGKLGSFRELFWQSVISHLLFVSFLLFSFCCILCLCFDLAMQGAGSKGARSRE